jgi:carboxyl-terminal processing protease
MLVEPQKCLLHFHNFQSAHNFVPVTNIAASRAISSKALFACRRLRAGDDSSTLHIMFRRDFLLRALIIFTHQWTRATYVNALINPEWNKSTWGRGSDEGRQFASSTVENLLASKGISSVLKLNDQQQLVVQAWSLMTAFYVFTDFLHTPDPNVWAGLLSSEVEKLDDFAERNQSYNAYVAIENSLLPALGDRYARLLRPDEAEEAEEIAEGGKAVGVGAAFALTPAQGEQPRVIEVIPGSLAALAGVRKGDKLLGIDGQRIGAGGKDAGPLIAGPVGSKVRAEFLRPVPGSIKDGDGLRFAVTLERALMTIEPVTFRWLDADVSLNTVGEDDGGGRRHSGNFSCAYLRILTFAGPPVVAPFREAVRPLRQVPGPSKILILDLCGNAGGSLSEAAAVTEMLLDLGRFSVRCGSGPVIVTALVDQDTASASEALLQGLRASPDLIALVVLGAGGAKRTFGKGVAQSRFDLSDGSALLLSVARFLPSGFAGISVDVVLPPGESDPIIRAREVAYEVAHRVMGSAYEREGALEIRR